MIESRSWHCPQDTIFKDVISFLISSYLLPLFLVCFFVWSDFGLVGFFLWHMQHENALRSCALYEQE